MKTNHLSQAAMFLLLLGCSEGSAEIPDKPNTNTKQEESQRSGPDTPDGFELEIIDAPHYLLLLRWKHFSTPIVSRATNSLPF